MTALTSETPSPPQTRRRAPFAIPVLLALAMLLGLSAAFVPQVRRQAALTFERQPQRYVAVYFQHPDTARECPIRSNTMRLAVIVERHALKGRAVGYRTSVRPAASTHAKGASAIQHRARGTVAATNPATSLIHLEVDVPRAAYTFVFRLIGWDQHLVLHCSAATGRSVGH